MATRQPPIPANAVATTPASVALQAVAGEQHYDGKPCVQPARPQ
jgi:hypothetical protein